MLGSVHRTGIELSSSRCTLVVADMAGGLVPRRTPQPVRVHRFATLHDVQSPRALLTELQALRETRGFPRRAWVTAWDVRSVHRYTWLSKNRQKQAASVAVELGATSLGFDQRDLTVGYLRGSGLIDPEKVELSLFAEASGDIRVKVAVFEAAGFVIEGVSTPCGALWSLARLRRNANSGEVHAYVALGPSTTAIAIVTNGFLLYGRQMPWGFAETQSGALVERGRGDIA